MYIEDILCIIEILDNRTLDNTRNSCYRRLKHHMGEENKKLLKKTQTALEIED